MAERPIAPQPAGLPDLPPDAPKLVNLYVIVIIALGVIGLTSIIGMIWISLANAELPDGLIAIGSVAIGALAALVKSGD